MACLAQSHKGAAWGQGSSASGLALEIPSSKARKTQDSKWTQLDPWVPSSAISLWKGRKAGRKDDLMTHGFFSTFESPTQNAFPYVWGREVM